MKLLNRFSVLTKRILAHKLYIVMLASIVLLTICYKLLPSSNKSADIVVDIYYEDSSSYADELRYELEEMNSIYTFVEVTSVDDIIYDLKSGKIECGFFIPDGFFASYIYGENQQILVYTTPATTFSATISESIFSNIMEVCAEAILIDQTNNPDLNDELASRLDAYINSDDIFTLKSTVSGEYDFKENEYTINLPVNELSIIYIIFSALLGLLLFYRDKEKNMYIALKSKEVHVLKLISITTAIVPIFIVCLLSNILLFGMNSDTLFLPILAILSFVCTYLLSYIIRKSTRLAGVLPLVAFISTIVVFVSGLI